jgi:hypothetical protein
MHDMKSYLITAAVVLVVMALVARVAPLSKIVNG